MAKNRDTPSVEGNSLWRGKINMNESRATSLLYYLQAWSRKADAGHETSRGYNRHRFYPRQIHDRADKANRRNLGGPERYMVNQFSTTNSCDLQSYRDVRGDWG